MNSSSDACLVFADVSGSTRLYEKLGDVEAQAAIERCIDAMKRATLINKGQVIKTIGDEVMALFESAAQGMQASSEMQQRIDAMPPLGGGVKLAIRVGMHFGPVLLTDHDVFGDTVNTAARMSGLAKAGQIITTAETVAALPELLRASCREIDSFPVKGKAEAVHVCEVIWQESAELTMMSKRTAPAVSVETRLRLLHGSDELILDSTRPMATLGRDVASDVVIHDIRASRSHAKIERRRDKYVLVDMSSNGTFITFQGEGELMLKREEVTLRSSGQIVFGHAWSSGESTDVLKFSVEAGD